MDKVVRLIVIVLLSTLIGSVITLGQNNISVKSIVYVKRVLNGQGNAIYVVKCDGSADFYYLQDHRIVENNCK